MKQRTDKVVRIGGASGFWGDSSLGPVQLVRAGGIDYLVFDYLAELTMSILAGARMKRPEEGYAIDFVTVALRSVLKQAVEQGIRIVSNAGGVNPKGCAAAVQALADELGVPVRIAIVEGDDVLPLAAAMRDGRHGRDVQRRTDAATAGDRQCLPRRAADRARARRGRRHRHHRPLRRQRGHPRRADARVRLGGRRLRPARRGQPRRPHHRMRLPGDRAACTPTGPRCPTGPTSAIRSSSAARTAASSSPSRRRRAGWSRPRRSESNCCTRSAIRPTTCCRTWCATSARCAWNRSGRIACS